MFGFMPTIWLFITYLTYPFSIIIVFLFSCLLLTMDRQPGFSTASPFLQAPNSNLCVLDIMKTPGGKKKAWLFSCIMLGSLDSCPEQTNQQITQNEIGTESWAHSFVSLFSLCSSFLGLMAKLNSKFSLSISKRLQRAWVLSLPLSSCSQPEVLVCCLQQQLRTPLRKTDTAQRVWLTPASSLRSWLWSFQFWWIQQLILSKKFFYKFYRTVLLILRQSTVNHRLFHHNWRVSSFMF